MNHSPTIVRGYDRLAPIYDPLASLYSGGQIAACHRSIAARLTPGSRVLFVGVGNGRDAAAAARRGVAPTLLDLSGRMLERAARRVRRSGVEPTLIEADLREYRAESPFDAVVASFFLNVFRTDELPAIVTQLASCVRRGGRIWVADFAPPRGRWLARTAQRLYHDLPMFTFGALTGNAIHSMHDVRREFCTVRIEIASSTSTRVFGVGPRWLEVVEGIAPDASIDGVEDPSDPVPRGTTP